MIYSIREIANTYLNDFIIDPPFYQEEYDYNNCVLRIINFFNRATEYETVKELEITSLLEGDEINEREILTELMLKAKKLEAFDDLVEKDFVEVIHYWKGLYSLEDNNID